MERVLLRRWFPCKRYVKKFEATVGPQQEPPDDHPLLVAEADDEAE